MANVKITDLTAYTNPVSTDVLPIVDVGTDVTKKVSIADLLENAGSGTASAPGIAFDGDSNTGIYRPGADQVAISTNGTGRVIIGSSGEITIGKENVTNAVINAPESVFVNIDSNDDDTGEAFIVGTNRSSTAGGTELFRIQEDGKVGLGTSSPGALLTVEANSTNTSFATTNHPAQTAGILSRNISNTVGNYQALTLLSNNGSSAQSASLVAQSVATGSAPEIHLTQRTGFNVNTTRLMVSSSGNVGIGTTAPSEKLDLNGALRISGQTGFVTNDAVTIDWESSESALRLLPRTSSDGIIKFYTTSSGSISEKARLDSSGRLLVGTSSATGNATTEIKGGTLSTTAATNRGGMLRVQSGAGNMSTASSITISDYFSIAPRRVMGVVYATTVDTSGHRTRSWKVYGKIGALSIVDDVNDYSSGGGSTPNLVLTESTSGVLTITPSWAFGGLGYVWSVDLLVGCAAS